jgi:3-sulfinopropanoyl-CoA desulfinase
VLFDLPPRTKELRERVRAIAARDIAPHAAETDRTEQYPWACVEALRREGFMGMTIPEAYGGKGAAYLDAIVLIEEMAKACSTVGRICVESNMGALGAIMKYGSDAQKRLAAALVLAGDKPAICITEPAAGSAATEMTTRADRRGDQYVLNGTKHWITGGGISRLHLVFARTFDAGNEQGIAGFIIVRDAQKNTPKGLIIGNREPAMGVRGLPETELRFEDLEVPEDMVLIPPEGIRRGFAGLMNAYNGQRPWLRELRRAPMRWRSIMPARASSSAAPLPSFRAFNGCLRICPLRSPPPRLSSTKRPPAPGMDSPTNRKRRKPRSSPPRRLYG